METAVVYARRDDVDDPISLDMQEHLGIQHCFEHGYSVAFYTGESASSITEGRRIHQIEGLARLGLLQVLVVTSHSRISRSAKTVDTLLQSWHELGLRVETVSVDAAVYIPDFRILLA